MAIIWITKDDTREPDSEYAALAAEAASWILYKLSGEKYAGVRSTVEWYGLPGAECSACLVTDPIIAAQINPHNHISVPVHSTTRAHSRALRLRGQPVQHVTRVLDADGVEIPSSDYKLVNSAYVVRSSDVPWDFAGGVTVEYVFGVYPPSIGRLAAIKLANEFIALYSDDDSCSLPERVTSSVSRQGVSYTILDPQTFLENGRTGIYEIDLFLAAANPTRARKKPRVFSPDIPRGER